MIGYYVHHHGRGHLERCKVILRCLDRPATVLTSLDVDPSELPDGTELLRLPHDTDGTDAAGAADLSAGGPGSRCGDPTGRGALHWAPLGSRGLQERARLMVGWLSRPGSTLLVSDVSVEAVVLARLCGVPAVAVRYHGDRRDRPHRLAWDLAVGLLAPYPEVHEQADVGAEVRRRTFYGGLLSRFAGRPTSRGEARRQLGVGVEDRLLVIALGAGGHDLDPACLPAIAAALTGWHVVLLGGPGEGASPVRPSPPRRLRDGPGATVLGWVADPFPWLRAADVVVGHGGQNLVGEVAAAGRPFICVPQDRPHHEQRRRAEVLGSCGLATVVPHWPEPGDWPAIVARAPTEAAARRLAGHTASAHATARWLEALARRTSSTC